MRIAAYAQVHRTFHPTGVGKHILHMTRQIATVPGVELQVAATRADLDLFRKNAGHSAFGGLSVTAISWNRSALEKSWAFLRWPAIDGWCADPAWIYSPSEVFVATRRSRLATTVHCLNWFDPELPWYSNPETRSTRRRLRMAWGPMFRRSDVILTVSEFYRRRIAALMGVEERRIAVVGNGVEDAFFTAGRSPPSGPVRPRPYVVVVGGLCERKGAPAVLAVARELLARSPETEIVVAGHTERDYLRATRELPNVVHLGYVSAEDGLPRLLSGSIALLFLSRYETFGIPAVEAMAAGTPAIVSGHAALPEIVGDAGLVLESDDPSEVVTRIAELRRDDRLRRDLVARGLERASRFRWSACAAAAVRAMRERS